MKRAVVALAATLLLALPASAGALASRTWVSGSGDDNAACTPAAPCATWQGAIARTAPGGEIDALDSGTFGAVYLDQSMTLDGTGALAAVLTNGTAAITVNDPNAKVILRRMVLNGAHEITGAGASFGVDIQAARAVRVEGVRISDFQGAGIRLAASNSPARLSVLDTTIADNGGNGMSINAGTSGNAGTFTRATLRRVDLIDNDLAGIATSAGGSRGVSVNVFGTLIADNSSDGILSNGANSKVRISDTDIVGNAQGLRVLNGGALLSWGNNHVSANTIDGVPTGMIGPK